MRPATQAAPPRRAWSIYLPLTRGRCEPKLRAEMPPAEKLPLAIRITSLATQWTATLEWTTDPRPRESAVAIGGATSDQPEALLAAVQLQLKIAHAVYAPDPDPNVRMRWVLVSPAGK
jgi:hypothetical protein